MLNTLLASVLLAPALADHAVQAPTHVNQFSSHFLIAQTTPMTGTTSENIKRAQAFYDSGLAKARNRQHTEAIKDFSEAIRLNPDFVQAYIDRSSTYLPLQDGIALAITRSSSF